MHVAPRELRSRTGIPLFHKDNAAHARFMVTHEELFQDAASYNLELRWQCNVEVAAGSWLNADRIGSSRVAHSMLAKIVIEPEEAIDLQTLVQAAQRFATRKLNPMLETATTLYGVAHNLDITIDHGLRMSQESFKHLTHPAFYHPSFPTKPRK